jgi:hypothetical protein
MAIEVHEVSPHNDRPRRIKRTFYLPPNDVYALDEIQAREHRRTGKKPELSELVSQAIRLLDQKAEINLSQYRPE